MAVGNKNIKGFSGEVSVKEYFSRAHGAWQSRAMNSGVRSIQEITKNLREAKPLSEESRRAIWEAAEDSH